MNWATFRKRAYLPLIAVLIAVAIAVVFALPPNARIVGGVVLALLLMAPGHVGRWLLRDLLASRAHLARGENEQGLSAARRFLHALDARPWIRHAIWTQYGAYTLDVRAMALNNEGAALIELARLNEAKLALLAARKSDTNYAIPVYNLAVVAKLEGDGAGSEALAREAAHLGFAGGALDQTIKAIGETYARVAKPS